MIRRHFTAGAAALVAAMTLSAAPVRADVPVGAIEILSGPAAAYGIAIKAGLELALDEINKKGVLGGQKIALTVEDSAGNKDQAINAARKLIGRDKVVLVIGPTLSNEMFAVGPVTNERKVPTIGTSTTAAGITEMGPYIFRTSLPEADVIPVTKIKGLKPDAIGISALVEPVSGVLLQARQLGFGKETQFIGGNGSNSPKLGEIAGAAADGLIVGSPWFIAKPDPVSEKFVADFKAKYNKAPDQFAAQAYDTMFIAAAAIDRAGAADPDKIRDALTKTSFSGVMGPFTFTPGRDPASSEGVVVLEMQGGKFGIAK